MVNEGFRKYKMLTKVDASINLLNILLIDPIHYAFPKNRSLAQLGDAKHW